MLPVFPSIPGQRVESSTPAATSLHHEVYIDGTASAPSITASHDACYPTRQNCSCPPHVPVPLVVSAAAAPAEAGMYRHANEADLVLRIEKLLLDVIHALRLQAALRIVAESTAHHWRSDLAIAEISSGHLTRVVVEVKRPPHAPGQADAIDAPNTIGQLRDYMVSQSAAVGILTTWNRWFILHLESACAAFTAAALPEAGVTINACRDVHISRCFTWNDPQLLPSLTSAVARAVHLPVHGSADFAFFLTRTSRLLHRVAEAPQQWEFRALVSDVTAAQQGRDGLVLRATDPTGQARAVKFLLTGGASDASHEADGFNRWNRRLPPPAAAATTLAGRNVVVMPWLPGVVHQAEVDDALRTAVRTHVEARTDTGIVHPEPALKHLRRLSGGGDFAVLDFTGWTAGDVDVGRMAAALCSAKPDAASAVAAPAPASAAAAAAASAASASAALPARDLPVPAAAAGAVASADAGTGVGDVGAGDGSGDAAVCTPQPAPAGAAAAAPVPVPVPAPAD